MSKAHSINVLKYASIAGFSQCLNLIIKAIGNSEKMLDALNEKGGYAEYAKVLGLGINIEKSKNLTIPKYNGKVNFEYAKPVEEKKS